MPEMRDQPYWSLSWTTSTRINHMTLTKQQKIKVFKGCAYNLATVSPILKDQACLIKEMVEEGILSSSTSQLFDEAVAKLAEFAGGLEREYIDLSAGDLIGDSDDKA
jgi:hypothetical protein